jgi:hypothetical protein
LSDKDFAALEGTELVEPKTAPTRFTHRGNMSKEVVKSCEMANRAAFDAFSDRV